MYITEEFEELLLPRKSIEMREKNKGVEYVIETLNQETGYWVWCNVYPVSRSLCLNRHRFLCFTWFTEEEAYVAKSKEDLEARRRAIASIRVSDSRVAGEAVRIVKVTRFSLGSDIREVVWQNGAWL